MRYSAWWPRVLLIAVLVANAVGLWPDLSASRVDLNDNVSHFAMVQSIVRAVEHGGNPLDSWSPEVAFGFPLLRDYQTLPHLIVAAVYFLFFKSVSLLTVFCWIRFLAVLLLPLSFYKCARLLEWSEWNAFAAALLSPLISTPGLYGLEFGSYLWAGNGLFPQSVATHFLLAGIGCGYRAMRTGRGVRLTGLLLGLTALCHFVYGYIGAVSLVLMALMPGFDAPLARRMRWLGWVAVCAAAIAAYQIVPLALDGPLINHSHWEPAWKWDSFGATQVFQWLVTGELLDHGRLPVLSLFALLGAICIIRGWRFGIADPAVKFVICGAALWLLLFCGRPFLGPMTSLFGISPDMPLHRLIGGVHVFFLLMAARGLGCIWTEASRRKLSAAIPVLTTLLIFPMLQERAAYLKNNLVWSRTNLAAYAGGRAALDAALGRLAERGGRVYPGLATNWGGQFKVGDVPFYGFLARNHVPAVAFLYHAMALPGDLMPRLDEWNAAQYRLFAIRTVAAPAGITTPVPAFWTPLDQIGRFQLYNLPAASYFDVVDVSNSAPVTRQTFYAVNDAWMSSGAVAARRHILLDWREDAPAVAVNPQATQGDPGRIVSEREDGETYRAEFDAARASYLLFKMTFHPNWQVKVDGARAMPVMLTPGFIGIPVTPGHHKVECRYQGGALKPVLALLGLLMLCGVGWLMKSPIQASARRGISAPVPQR